MTLDEAREEAAGHLTDIKLLFKPGAKASVFIRFPNFPDRDFILTDDDLSEVVKMIERRDPTLLAKGVAE